MVSTYLSYNLVTRDLKGSLDRVAADSTVTRQTQHFKDNIGKVKTVDEFLDDYQLYSYAMKAHGLEEMTYAKAFMKKVLESDLNDEKSFANKLSDDRYRNFAAAFQFTAPKADGQTDAQQTKLLARYDQALAAESDKLETETKYYEKQIDTISSAQGLMGNSRLLNYALSAYGIDGPYYSKEHILKVLTSDVSDPDSYVNQLVANKGKDAAGFLRMASAFNFNADGSLSAATAQTAAQKENTVALYIDEEQTYVSNYYLEREKAYYTSKIASVTSVADITSDSRLFNYVKTAFQLEGTVTSTVFKNIVTSDLSVDGNFASTGGDAWVAVAQKFNFDTNGDVKAGQPAQGSTQLASTNAGFATFYDDVDQTKKNALTSAYKSGMAKVTKVDELLNNASMKLLLQRAFGIEAGEFSNADLRKALTSDFTDPASFANKSRDERLIAMSKLFNFDSKGNVDDPLQAHSAFAATLISKEYIVNKARFLEGNQLKAAKEAAGKEAAYYQDKIQGVETVQDLLADRRIIDVVLGAYGFDPKKVTDDFLKKAFASDLSDRKSFVNQQADKKWAELVGSFNFDGDGKLTRKTLGTVQQRGETLETINLFMRQTLEENEGQSSEAVRLALYFQRTAPTITSAYDIVADTALAEVFRTTFGFSEDFTKMKVESQAKVIKSKLDLADLQDPKKLQRLIERYTAMYDSANAKIDSPAVSILSGGNGTISGDLLLSIAQLKA
ncbi:DUF1217 domain-containing protein [Rhizobium wuzhouense]|uniref:Flagellar protein n=1 Tax=Rhizobium wuzhouense TaxID=1986026 RepID=A0ABX5NY86_9HYPH|nr:DUF1217 domain-containing protein [Rhizobium wuzhouense]PYB77253.1 flagellar protein [Rhizobium wuzhouense]